MIASTGKGDRWKHLLLFVAALAVLIACILSDHVVEANSPAPSDAAISTSSNPPTRHRDARRKNHVVVVGSINADTFLPVDRLPVEGENLTTRTNGAAPQVDVPGGKGCTQAVAAAKLMLSKSTATTSDDALTPGVAFVGQFGNDGAADLLQQALHDAHVDLQHCHRHAQLQSGRGYVFLTASGQVSAVVTGGSNTEGWTKWKTAWERYSSNNNDKRDLSGIDNGLLQELDHLLKDTKCILLQREVPEYVNLLVASYCKHQQRKNKNNDVIIIQDVGGEDRPMSREMLQLCDYIVPNESELKRLLLSFADDKHIDVNNKMDVVDTARALQKHGAHNVLVTQGCRGSTLVLAPCESDRQQSSSSPSVLYQPACPVLRVVDETGAGDCYRAGFAVALQEGKPLQECMAFAAAAGACAVTKQGAVPSTPSRTAVEERLSLLAHTRQHHHSDDHHHHHHHSAQDSVLNIPRGDGLESKISRGGASGEESVSQDDDFPFLIGSRLNSMKDRPELWDSPLLTPEDFVQRQAKIAGLTCVDFNYPQHFHTWSNGEAKVALGKVGLKAGAVCLRYPSKFARGAMNHPDESLRREAIQLTKEAAQVALDLGCNEVVVWSAFDGYDYPFQVDYTTKWCQLVDAFRECCDAYPNVKFSLEYKPTDENTRFFTVPSTGAAMLLVNEVDRANFGLTLDVGHMLMSGENPGQSIAMVGRAGKLFGIQLNDGFTRLAAEDGLMFGSVHPSMALEIVHQLRRTGFAGHLYFDTFPQRTDPIREAEYNIRRVKAFWAKAGSLDAAKLERVMNEHDAVGALEMVDEAMRTM